jgi:5-methylcytosine-specific restriction endonuclease McrA
MKTKICHKCRAEKPLEDFYKDKSSKDGRFHDCKQCWHEHDTKRYHDNPEFHKRRARQWERDNPERHKAQQKAWNTEATANGYFRDWYWRNHDKELARQREWRRNNPEKEKEHIKKGSARHRITRKEWQRLNPLKGRQYAHTRRARKISNGGTFTDNEFLAVCEQYGNKCLCCGSTENLTPDHIIPLSRGGKNIIENIQPLCLTCNKRKGTKIIDYRHPVVTEGV